MKSWFCAARRMFLALGVALFFGAAYAHAQDGELHVVVKISTGGAEVRVPDAYVVAHTSATCDDGFEGRTDERGVADIIISETCLPSFVTAYAEWQGSSTTFRGYGFVPVLNPGDKEKVHVIVEP